MVAVAFRHGDGLRITAVRFVVAAGVAQVDTAGERHILRRLPRMTEHHELLMMRATEPDPLVQQYLATRALDGLAEVLVLLLAVLEPVQV